ncbi:GOLPH3/VPS74 family protein [Streptomyces sp. NBC_00448]|uniref:GOLPH3/VPS74 family protein n=1 Tax=Streptomyces sp. NBC_00448 TaxID=2903652 RepID=UPI002E205534
MELTLAEELLLLSRNEQSGRLAASEAVSFGVAGAVLMELALDGRIGVRDNRVVALDGGSGALAVRQAGPPAEELWKRIREQRRPRRAARWVGSARNDKAYQKVRTGLRDRGIVHAERRRVLGLFPATRWTEADPVPAVEIRDRVARAVSGGDADERTVALVLLVDASELSARVFPRIDRRTRKDRLRKFAAGPWASEPVGEAVRAVTKGVTGALSSARAAQAANN